MKGGVSAAVCPFSSTILTSATGLPSSDASCARANTGVRRALASSAATQLKALNFVRATGNVDTQGIPMRKGVRRKVSTAALPEEREKALLCCSNHGTADKRGPDRIRPRRAQLD